MKTTHLALLVGLFMGAVLVRSSPASSSLPQKVRQSDGSGPHLEWARSMSNVSSIGERGDERGRARRSRSRKGRNPPTQRDTTTIPANVVARIAARFARICRRRPERRWSSGIGLPPKLLSARGHMPTYGQRAISSSGLSLRLPHPLVLHYRGPARAREHASKSCSTRRQDVHRHSWPANPEQSCQEEPESESALCRHSFIARPGAHSPPS